MESRSNISMLQTYKKKVEAELEKCEKVSENLMHNYITDIEELEKEGELHIKYEEVVGELEEHLEERKEGSLAMSNRKKWQAKPVAEESAKGKETGKYLLDQEEDLLQNVQSLDISRISI